MQANQSQADAIALDDLYEPAELAAMFPKVLSTNTLKWHLFNRHKNGLDTACVKGLRRKILISKSRFERWLATQTEAGRAAI